ncbi:hypothetical protein OBBRIDRAFT_798706 [Obba rivulosa]|uniref:Uncharacterized protein n=1 Tax=Obba rivulosa TaxID=1052685 RepID=A0A8E2AI39_9APHY|nr:hypothetical protein OBBRIDRAFT_798706 [Obba rivulosa]
MHAICILCAPRPSSAPSSTDTRRSHLRPSPAPPLQNQPSLRAAAVHAVPTSDTGATPGEPQLPDFSRDEHPAPTCPLSTQTSQATARGPAPHTTDSPPRKRTETVSARPRARLRASQPTVHARWHQQRAHVIADQSTRRHRDC